MNQRTLRPATMLDAEPIANLYNYYVAHTVVTFEEEPVSAGDMAARIERVASTHPWLVCDTPDGVVGYAYAAPWHARCAYRLSTETTIYVRSDSQRQGVGTALYSALLEELRQRRFHCAVGGIALPNDGSIALHERFGFAEAGRLVEVGWKFGRWIDVGYWQLIL